MTIEEKTNIIQDSLWKNNIEATVPGERSDYHKRISLEVLVFTWQVNIYFTCAAHTSSFRVVALTLKFGRRYNM